MSDTNLWPLFTMLLEAQKVAGAQSSVFDHTSLIMLLLALAPTQAAVAPIIKTKASMANTEETKITAKETRETSSKMAASVEAMHKDHSEREAMMLEVKTLRDEILRICMEKAVLERRLSERIERTAGRGGRRRA
jgi:hypothetical protein